MRTRLSVFLITLSGLVLEVGLTRIYSASVWYHFAFVAISVALLGWGLGGFTVHLLKRKFALSMNAAAIVTTLYAVSIPLCLSLLAHFPFEMERLPLYFLAPLVPFFLAGMPEMMRWLWRDGPVSTDPNDMTERAFRQATAKTN